MMDMVWNVFAFPDNFVFDSPFAGCVWDRTNNQYLCVSQNIPE